VKTNDERFLQFLDGLRGLAAFYVMVGHARWMLWEGYFEGYLHHPETYPLPAKLLVYFFLLFSYGHQAVMLFFVLSGFLIHLRYAKQLEASPENAHFGWWGYVVRRVKRLYPPLIFAILLTYLLDRWGASLGYSIYFHRTPYPLINLNVNPDHSLPTALGNLTFLMGIYVPMWGSNGALWSLMFEWGFYMLYPIFWWLTKRSIHLSTGIIVTLWVLSFVPIWGARAWFQGIFMFMIIWWFGALLAEIYVGRLAISLWRIAPLALLLPVLVPLVIPISQLSGNIQALQDVLWGLAFMGLIAAGLAWKQRGGSLWLVEQLKPLGDMSYTLYVVHLPIVVFMSGFVMSRSPDQILPWDFGWVITAIVVCLAVAYAAHFFTEKPFIRRRVAAPVQPTVEVGVT
jgi:peptidoglycan/LPS O-acetylase OafA/YrhL